MPFVLDHPQRALPQAREMGHRYSMGCEAVFVFDTSTKHSNSDHQRVGKKLAFALIAGLCQN